MAYETIVFEKRSHVAHITLNRPRRANTINAQLMDDVNRALDEISGDRDLRALILTGAGKHFCAGADLRSMGTELPRRTALNFISHLEDLSVPVICAINGSAMGGGCEIALACDIRIMSETAEIGLPEIRFGALPAGGGTQRLPRLVGPSIAKELILTGLPIDAQQAHRIGLVNRVTAPEALMPTCEELAAVLIERAGYALSAAKFLINEGMKMDLEAGLKLEHRIIAKMASGKERQEAIQRAMEKQPTYAHIFSKRDEDQT